MLNFKVSNLDWCTHLEGTNYITTKEITWAVGKKNSGLSIVVPKGFIFNSSVPWYLWWLISPYDTTLLLAACLHDYLLQNEYRLGFANGEWLDGAKVGEASWWKRLVGIIGISWWLLVKTKLKETLEGLSKWLKHLR